MLESDAWSEYPSLAPSKGIVVYKVSNALNLTELAWPSFLTAGVVVPIYRCLLFCSSVYPEAMTAARLLQSAPKGHNVIPRITLECTLNMISRRSGGHK